MVCQRAAEVIRQDTRQVIFETQMVSEDAGQVIPQLEMIFETQSAGVIHEHPVQSHTRVVARELQKVLLHHQAIDDRANQEQSGLARPDVGLSDLSVAALELQRNDLQKQQEGVGNLVVELEVVQHQTVAVIIVRAAFIDLIVCVQAQLVGQLRGAAFQLEHLVPTAELETHGVVVDVHQLCATDLRPQDEGDMQVGEREADPRIHDGALRIRGEVQRTVFLPEQGGVAQLLPRVDVIGAGELGAVVGSISRERPSHEALWQQECQSEACESYSQVG